MTALDNHTDGSMHSPPPSLSLRHMLKHSAASTVQRSVHSATTGPAADHAQHATLQQGKCMTGPWGRCRACCMASEGIDADGLVLLSRGHPASFDPF